MKLSTEERDPRVQQIKRTQNIKTSAKDNELEEEKNERKSEIWVNCDEVKKIERNSPGMERQSTDKTYLKKGPWTADEDEALMNYVNKYGPRDWSSLRSKGLLPRTGKSCRLRWVNKLRPNLKT